MDIHEARQETPGVQGVWFRVGGLGFRALGFRGLGLRVQWGSGSGVRAKSNLYRVFMNAMPVLQDSMAVRSAVGAHDRLAL